MSFIIIFFFEQGSHLSYWPGTSNALGLHVYTITPGLGMLDTEPWMLYILATVPASLFSHFHTYKLSSYALNLCVCMGSMYNVWRGAHLCLNVWKPEVGSQYLPLSSPLPNWLKPRLNEPEVHFLGRLASLWVRPRLQLSLSPAWGSQNHDNAPGFYLDARDPSWDPHASSANTWPTESPSKVPAFVFKYCFMD